MNEIVVSYPPELLTKKLAACMLSTTEWQIRSLCRQNKLSPVDDGTKFVKFRLEDVRRYIKSLPDKLPAN